MVADRAPHPPSVEHLLAAVRPRRPAGQDHVALAEAARGVLDDERRRLAEGGDPRSLDALADELSGRLRAWAAVPTSPTINATGVIVHTNLGRAPWPQEALDAAAAASGSLLLELDRTTGRRGPRFRLAEDHLVALTGAEDALVTNNNAAAVALAVGLAGRGRGVAVSRGRAHSPSTRSHARSPVAHHCRSRSTGWPVRRATSSSGRVRCIGCGSSWRIRLAPERSRPGRTPAVDEARRNTTVGDPG